MTDGTEMTLATLAKKIDEQARFTRSVSIICTLSILGVMFYTLTEMFSNLPNMIILQFMGNLEKINQEWKAIDNTQRIRTKAAAAAAAPVAAPVK
ncbi:hypothetical protein BH10CYA1_BH10CYA1_62670 [soil metagenome]